MHPKRPIWHFSRRTNDRRILSRNLCRIRLTSSKEVEIQNTTNNIILQGCVRRSLVKLDVHPVRIKQEDPMRAGLSMLEVYGVTSVKIRSNLYPVCITRPESQSFAVSGQMKRVTVLSQAIYISLRGKSGFDAEILGLKYERMGRSSEENLPSVRALDGEGERGEGVIELNRGRFGGDMGVN